MEVFSSFHVLFKRDERGPSSLVSLLARNVAYRGGQCDWIMIYPNLTVKSDILNYGTFNYPVYHLKFFQSHWYREYACVCLCGWVCGWMGDRKRQMTDEFSLVWFNLYFVVVSKRPDTRIIQFKLIVSTVINSIKYMEYIISLLVM